VSGLLRRHRRLTALVGTILVLSVVGLDAHAALPAHHGVHDAATVCIAGLAIATLAAVGSLAKQVSTTAGPLLGPRRTGPFRDAITPAPRPRSRAGPPGSLPLRR
jgi:hypothetical protein